MSFPSSLPMARARAAAAAAGARGEVPVGAVIVDPTGAIIAGAGMTALASRSTISASVSSKASNTPVSTQRR